MEYVSPYQDISTNHPIFLATNENPENLPQAIQKQLYGVMSSTNRYPHVENIELKKKIALKHDVLSENIVLGAGSDELLMLIAIRHLSRGKKSVMANPSFFRYKQLTELVGGECRLVDCRDFCHDLNAMKNAIEEETKVIFICNPNNPTGTLVPHKEIEQFMSEIPRDILVVIDEAYFDYVWPKHINSSIELIKRYPNLIVLRTFSKFYALAGLRIGYGVANADLIREMNRIRSPYNINSIAQEAALLILDDKTFEERTYNEVQNGKEFYYQEFKKLGLNYIPSHTNFIFVHFGKECEELCNQLKMQSIIIRSCRLFGFPEYVRITVGKHEENALLIEHLKKLLS